MTHEKSNIKYHDQGIITWTIDSSQWAGSIIDKG